MLICIDPGHSGLVEPGACAGEFTEATLNLVIANYLVLELKKLGYSVCLTRSCEIQSDSLIERCDLANESEANYFVSIHCNSAGAATAKGVETYHYHSSEAGAALATAVQTELVNLHYTKDRGIKEASFTVLKYTNMPAILVECAFMSNDEDLSILTNNSWQEKIAGAIAIGISRHIVNA